MASRNRKQRNVAKIESTYVKQHEQQVALKSKERKRLFRRLSAFGVLFTIIMVSIFTLHLNQRAQMEEKQILYDQQLSTLNEYKSKHAELEREVKLLNDIDYLLQIARKDYFFSKDGEIIFKLPDEDPSY